MNSIRKILKEDFPIQLREMNGPPDFLYIRGTLPPPDHIFLTIVGARRYTDYGKQVLEELVGSLQGLPVVIVSGLAFGIDALTHKAALSVGLKTIAVPGSGLHDDVLYPRENFALAQKILATGGALLSPFECDLRAAPWTFPVRNRIMAGISQATLVIEAELQSGTLITSKFAGDFNRNVLAVPGSIFSSKSTGPHMLIKTGATPITCPNDLIEALGFTSNSPSATIDTSKLTPDEQLILRTLDHPLNRDELFEKVNLSASSLNTALSMLEIRGLTEELLGEIRKK